MKMDVENEDFLKKIDFTILFFNADSQRLLAKESFSNVFINVGSNLMLACDDCIVLFFIFYLFIDVGPIE
jgi:hypothetical protein